MPGLTPGRRWQPAYSPFKKQNFGDRALQVLEYSVNISLGASNVSFGLPGRHSVNSAFLAVAIQAGATTSITNPIKLGASIRAIDLLLGKDANSSRYLKYFRATEKLREQEAAMKV